MKKLFKKTLALVLALCMLFSVTAVGAGAVTAEEDVQVTSLEDYLATSEAPIDDAASAQLMETFAKFIRWIANVFINDFLLGTIANLVPRSSNYLKMEDVNLEDMENFFKGSESFIEPNEVSKDAVWQLGYASESILPDDFGTAEYKYTRGSYIPYWFTTEVYTDEDGNKEDIKVRTVAMNDGRGTVIFASIDCIGISNADIRKIRAAITEEEIAKYGIISINVTATHTHSGIDTQGVWTAPISTLANNVLRYTFRDLDNYKSGVNEDLLDKIVESSAKSIRTACENMTEGDLYYARTNIADYVRDRTPPYACDTEMYRLVFAPYKKSVTPTLIATFGCHPESASYDYLTTDNGIQIDSKLSADFVYYMEKVCNKAGYNFIFIQGNVGTNTSSRGLSSDGLDHTSHLSAVRFGYELGYIALSMTMNEEERIALNEATGDLLGIAEHAGEEHYTVWYEGRETVTEEKVLPMLNVRHEQILIPLDNNVAKILLKTGIASNTLVFDKRTLEYFAFTEIGYMEIGDSVKIFLDPGELMSELLLDSSALSEFPYKALRDYYGEDLIVCDLMNDAAGYIEPDPYYTVVGVQYDPEAGTLESDTWCLLVSMGQQTASTIIGEFIDLVESVS